MDESSLRHLPAIDRLLKSPGLGPLLAAHGVRRVTRWVRESTEQLRRELVEHPRSVGRDDLAQEAEALVHAMARREASQRFDRVINATGVVLHTNLGRAPLADRAIEAIGRTARCGNLEIDLDSGSRRHRGHQLEPLWKELVGAQASLVVNNCASATVLALAALAAGREVAVSRGQLIEIGGAFRLPDVFRQSGAILREVGTTNRTRLADYAQAIGPATAAFLRVHPSNFRIMGFTESVEIEALAKLAHDHGLLAIDDIGSGALVDLRPYGLPEEPLIADSLAAGADLVLFSGDKLLGGPQCGVLLGRPDLIARIREHPLARAVRIDKLTLAAIQATLEIHLAGRALDEIPVLHQLTTTSDELRRRADQLLDAAKARGIRLEMEVRSGSSAVGGGSLPTATLPTWLLAVRSPLGSVDQLARRLRTGLPPVLARVEEDAVMIDPRTLLPGDEELLIASLEAAQSQQKPAAQSGTGFPARSLAADGLGKQRVVFVCVENSNRSQMAEAFARIHGSGRLESASAGSRPSGRVNPQAIEAMRELGYDLGGHRSKSVADLSDVEFDVAVTMGCGDDCPRLRAKRRLDWNIPDPKDLPPDQFRQVRDLIERKVRELLESLSIPGLE